MIATKAINTRATAKNTPLNRDHAAAAQGEMCGLKTTVAGAGALEPAFLQGMA